MADIEPNDTLEDATGLGVIGLTRAGYPVDVFDGWTISTRAGWAGSGVEGDVAAPVGTPFDANVDADPVDHFAVGVSVGVEVVQYDLFFFSMHPGDFRHFELKPGQVAALMTLNVSVSGALNGPSLKFEQGLGLAAIDGQLQQFAAASSTFANQIVLDFPTPDTIEAELYSRSLIIFSELTDVFDRLIKGQFNENGEEFAVNAAVDSATRILVQGLPGYALLKEMEDIIRQSADGFWNGTLLLNDEPFSQLDDIRLGHSLGIANIMVTGQYQEVFSDNGGTRTEYGSVDYDGIGIEVAVIDYQEIQDVLEDLEGPGATVPDSSSNLSDDFDLPVGDIGLVRVEQNGAGQFVESENRQFNPGDSTPFPGDPGNDPGPNPSQFTEGPDTVSISGATPVFALGGDDYVLGDDGPNVMHGNAGFDTLEGFAGNDTIYGGPGGDDIYGGAGNDLIYTGAGDESYEYVDTGSGADTVDLAGMTDGFLWVGSYFQDNPIFVFVDSTDDVANLTKGAQGSTVILNSSNAMENGGIIFDGTEFNDHFNLTLEGNDLVVIQEYYGSNSYRIDGTSGYVDLFFGGLRIVADLDQGTIQKSDGTVDSVDLFGDVRLSLHTSAEDDVFAGSQRREQIYYSGGNDTLDAQGGVDRINFGGSFCDGLSECFMISDVHADLELGAATAIAGPNAFNVVIENFEDIRGTFVGQDTLLGSSSANRIQGRSGDDRIEGRAGHDRLDGDDGNDTVIGGQGNDTINGNDGTDNLQGGLGDDSIVGGTSEEDLRDLVLGGDGDDTIDGGYGNDELRGEDGDDNIAGGFGVDTVIGGNGNDVMTGSAFSDLVFGGAGADFVNGGFGSDRINGGAGADRFFHVGVAGHGSDWIQDFDTNEGDVLVYGGAANLSDFQVNFANTASAGTAGVDEAFVIYRPSGQILWALVDGAGQSSINIQIAGDTFDLLA